MYIGKTASILLTVAVLAGCSSSDGDGDGDGDSIIDSDQDESGLPTNNEYFIR